MEKTEREAGQEAVEEAVTTVEEALARWPWLELVKSAYAAAQELRCTRCGSVLSIQQETVEGSELRAYPEDKGGFSQSKTDIIDGSTEVICDCVVPGGHATYDICFAEYY